MSDPILPGNQPQAKSPIASKALQQDESPNVSGPMLTAAFGRFWKQSSDWVKRFFPLTWAGCLLSLILALTVKYRGLEQFDLVALAAGSGLAVVLGLALLAVIPLAALLRLQTAKPSSLAQLDLISGRRVQTGFVLEVWKYIPLLRFHWSIGNLDGQVDLEASQLGQLRETLLCKRRGLEENLTREFTVSDTFGLVSLSWQRNYPGRVRVLPDPGRLEDPQVVLSLVSGEDLSDPRGDPAGDRVDMRQYSPSDPMKFILWKVYSRSGKVMIRVPERALTARPRACCYLLAGPYDEATAALARVILQRGYLGEQWRFGADGRPNPAHVLNDALDLLALSGREQKPTLSGLVAFLRQAELDGYTFCLLLAPAGDIGLEAQACQCLRESALRSEVWIGLDPIGSSQNPWWEKVFSESPKALNEKEIDRRWLGQATLVERTSGRVVRSRHRGIA